MLSFGRDSDKHWAVTRGRLLLFSSTLLVFFVAAVAVLFEPPPLWVPLGLGLFYLGVIGVGVMNLSWEMFGPAFWRSSTQESIVGLTFDDGPDPVSTREVLRLLKEHGAKATFFVVGKKAERHPEVLREIVAQGHALGLHSYSHNRLYAFLPPAEVVKDIERTRQIIEQACGESPIYFRPPVGQMSPRTAEGVKRAQVETIGWSVRARDGLPQADAAACLKRTLKGLEAGAIVLLHDAWEQRATVAGADSAESLADCPAGARILEELLRECRARGLRPVTLDRLIASEQEA